LGSEFAVKNRYEQQEDTFKIMKIEKLISYLFLTFILVVACFNIISSISMLLIDKKDDIITLRNMGASKSQIVSIFMTEGKLISLIGALAGIALGVTLCLLQQQFGFIKFGAAEGDHIISTYPVELQLFDIVLTFVTVIVVGYIAVWFPVKHFSKKFFM
jgi:lipoprotein-releasing system permease protein